MGVEDSRNFFGRRRNAILTFARRHTPTTIGRAHRPNDENVDDDDDDRPRRTDARECDDATDARGECECAGRVERVPRNDATLFVGSSADARHHRSSFRHDDARGGGERVRGERGEPGGGVEGAEHARVAAGAAAGVHFADVAGYV